MSDLYLCHKHGAYRPSSGDPTCPQCFPMQLDAAPGVVLPSFRVLPQKADGPDLTYRQAGIVRAALHVEGKRLWVSIDSDAAGGGFRCELDAKHREVIRLLVDSWYERNGE